MKLTENPMKEDKKFKRFGIFYLFVSIENVYNLSSIIEWPPYWIRTCGFFPKCLQ